MRIQSALSPPRRNRPSHKNDDANARSAVLHAELLHLRGSPAQAVVPVRPRGLPDHYGHRDYGSDQRASPSSTRWSEVWVHRTQAHALCRHQTAWARRPASATFHSRRSPGDSASVARSTDLQALLALQLRGPELPHPQRDVSEVWVHRTQARARQSLLRLSIRKLGILDRLHPLRFCQRGASDRSAGAVTKAPPHSASAHDSCALVG